MRHVGFERIRVLRHLFGGSGNRELARLDSERSLQGQVELRSLLSAVHEHEMADSQLTDLAYSVVDTETTGFSPLEDHLLSIGAVNCDPLKPQNDAGFHTFLQLPSGQVVPSVVTELTGITTAQLVLAPQPDKALQAFLQYVGDRLIVAHHAAHDIRFLSLALRRAWSIEWQAQVLDTGKLAMCLHTFKKYPSLDMLLSLYEIPVTERHTALGDARMTEHLLRALLAELITAGVQTLGDLWERLLLLEHSQKGG